MVFIKYAEKIAQYVNPGIKYNFLENIIVTTIKRPNYNIILPKIMFFTVYNKEHTLIFGVSHIYFIFRKICS